MKKNKLILGMIFVMILIAIQTQAQDNKEIKKFSKISFTMYGGLGHSIIENKNEVNYNLDYNYGEFLLNYNFNSGFGFATGVGFAELTGNAFNSIGHFYQERQVLRIPILATIKYEMTSKTKLLFDVGVYGQNIIKDQYTYVDQVHKDVYEGKSYGFQIGTGFVFEFFEGISIGLSFKSQVDFNNIKTSPSSILKDEQKYKALSSIGLLMINEF